MPKHGTAKNDYITPNTMAQQVAEHLSERIIKGELEIGHPLRILDLTDQYSASQTTIREAIHILEKKYLVETIPRRGTFIRGVTAEEIYDVWEIKKRLWSFAMQTFCRYHQDDKELIREARYLYEHLSDAAQKGMLDEAFQISFQLGDFVIKNCGNRQLGNMLESIEFLVKQWRYQSIRLDDNVKETARLIGLSIKSIEDGNSELSERYMADFIEMDRNTLLKHLKELNHSSATQEHVEHMENA